MALIYSEVSKLVMNGTGEVVKCHLLVERAKTKKRWMKYLLEELCSVHPLAFMRLVESVAKCIKDAICVFFSPLICNLSDGHTVTQ